jgi:hypothetical protein
MPWLAVPLGVAAGDRGRRVRGRVGMTGAERWRRAMQRMLMCGQRDEQLAVSVVVEGSDGSG